MRGIIIGAGIGGLSTAIAMQKKNIDVRVFDSAPRLSSVGAGILIPPNAMTILDRYGLSEQLRASGISIDTLAILDPTGKVLSKASASFANNGVEQRTVAIHRGMLQQILLDALSPGVVLTGKHCVQVNNNLDGVAAEFRDGTSETATFLVGADGIHSNVRESINLNSPLRYSGQTCWRGVASMTLPLPWRRQLTEVWGAGIRFGFVQIADEQVYWFATQCENAGGKDNAESIKQELLEKYKNFFEPIPEIISSTASTTIFRHDIYDLQPLKKWHVKSVILIGDAAHAATPNLGQGGAQAIEDSWVLAQKIADCQTPSDAFERFQAVRYAKVKKIVDTSWQLGKISNISNKTACKIRNTLLTAVPDFVTKQQARVIYKVAY